MARPTNVAKEVLSYCTSCKMDLNHIIVAMQGDRIAKVQCKTCQKIHAYKAAKGVTEPSAAPKPAKKKTKKASAEEQMASSVEAEWEKLMAVHKAAAVKPYTIKTQFTIGDKLKHATFGEGIVGKLIYPNKIEVIFQHDVKILIHGGQPAV